LLVVMGGDVGAWTKSAVVIAAMLGP
jgi:hypothetical protein